MKNFDDTEANAVQFETLFECSVHALKRTQQRGVSQRSIDIIRFHGDIEFSQSKGRTRVGLSRQRKLELIRAGAPIHDIERAERLELVVAEDGTLVTVLKVDPRQHLRHHHFRRGHMRQRRMRRG